MPVRKTERRLPFDFTAGDLGHHALAVDSRSLLVSYNPDPVTMGRLQRYAVFVTDEALAGQVHQFEWRLQNAGSNVTQTTDIGYLNYTPEQQGALSITVTLKSDSDAALGSVELSQSVVPLNPQLETLYSQTEEVAPLAGQPETSREIINDLRAYMDELAPRDADPDSALNKLLFAIAYGEVMRKPLEQREPALEEIAQALHADDASAFLNRAREGIGVCQLRPHILAMYLNREDGAAEPIIAKESFPQEQQQRVEVENRLLAALEALDENTRIDLFNVLRFPKLNLKMALHMIDALRDELYSGEQLPAVMADREKIINLIQQFKTGPLLAE